MVSVDQAFSESYTCTAFGFCLLEKMEKICLLVNPMIEIMFAVLRHYHNSPHD